MKDTKIACLGAGNMGRCLISGLIADGVDASRITVFEPDTSRLQQLAVSSGIQVASDNAAAAEVADVIILAVKPQIMRSVTREIAPVVGGSEKLVVSVAAGIRIRSLENWLASAAAVVRVMPNTPALVRAGASALYANDAVSGPQRDLAEAIMRAVGVAVWVDNEAMLDAVTALSGSGPAYFFLLIEQLEKVATELGLNPETSHLLAVQTAFGAAKMALESHDDAATLREKVTSPGGTTEAALRVLSSGLPELVNDALKAAYSRSNELAETFGDDK